MTQILFLTMTDMPVMLTYKMFSMTQWEYFKRLICYLQVFCTLYPF